MSSNKHFYILLNYKEALFISALFISIMQLGNGAQFKSYFLSVLYTGAAGNCYSCLACMYAPLQSHKFDLIIDVLNLMLLS